MWVYKSPIGLLRIQKTREGQYGLWLGGKCYETSNDPQAEADNVYVHVTGCWEWDRLDGKVDAPTCLAEWEWQPDP